MKRLLHCMIGLFISQQALAQDFNVVVVFDASGSMHERMDGGSRLDIAKQALKTVVPTIYPGTQVGIVCFSDVSPDWVYPLSVLETSKISAAIDSIVAKGGTPLGEYIKIGADELLAQREKQKGNGYYRLLVITDGEAADQYDVDRYVPDIISRGIRVDAIGVGMKQDHTLATKVHNYYPGNDLASLKNAISKTFAEIKPADVEQDFDLISSVEPALAKAIIKSFSEQSNHPVGTPRPERTVHSDGSITYAAPASSGTSWFTMILAISAAAGSGAVVLIVLLQSRSR